jgi:hypothetical protein
VVQFGSGKDRRDRLLSLLPIRKRKGGFQCGRNFFSFSVFLAKKEGKNEKSEMGDTVDHAKNVVQLNSLKSKARSLFAVNDKSHTGLVTGKGNHHNSKGITKLPLPGKK